MDWLIWMIIKSILTWMSLKSSFHLFVFLSNLNSNCWILRTLLKRRERSRESNFSIFFTDNIILIFDILNNFDIDIKNNIMILIMKLSKYKLFSGNLVIFISRVRTCLVCKIELVQENFDIVCAALLSKIPCLAASCQIEFPQVI